MGTQIIFDEYLKFPLSSEHEQDFEELVTMVGSVEKLEECFGIEFSCGDGKYFSNLYSWSDNKEGLQASVTDDELLKYDGKVDLDFPPQFQEDQTPFVANRPYRFTIKMRGEEGDGELIFFINSKERSREDA